MDKTLSANSTAKDNNQSDDQQDLVGSTAFKTIKNLKKRQSMNDNNSDSEQNDQQKILQRNIGSQEKGRYQGRPSKKKDSLAKTGQKFNIKQNKNKFQSQEADLNDELDGDRVSTGDIHGGGRNGMGYGQGEDSTIDANQSPNLQINNLYQSDDKQNAKRRSQNQKYKMYGNSDQESKRYEYHPVDIQMAIEFVLTKSKMIKDKIEMEQFSDQFIKDSVSRNKTFKISYDSYLQKLINAKQINAEFKNVQQGTFSKLEKFFMNQITKYQSNMNIHHQYIMKSRNIWDSFNKRIKQLQEQIEESYSDRNNEWNF